MCRTSESVISHMFEGGKKKCDIEAIPQSREYTWKYYVTHISHIQQKSHATHVSHIRISHFAHVRRGQKNVTQQQLANLVSTH